MVCQPRVLCDSQKDREETAQVGVTLKIEELFEQAQRRARKAVDGLDGFCFRLYPRGRG